MSDIMRPIPFSDLMNWVITEHKNEKSIFGVRDIYKHTADKFLPIFTEKIETPFGPAAGPHTQLAQNLIVSYIGGSRFFEVKTVQIIDGEDLPVAKPCITAEDECYNCEWSTELRVPQAFDEYVKGWFALKLLSKTMELGDQDGFVFNMSVGYDLAGIKSKKIDDYIEGMKDASTSAIWKECVAWSKANLDMLPGVDETFIDAINPQVCSSITLSTLHGCPPDEIERIATYLIEKKKLNTYIKCNPTLLGYAFARKTLDAMGYDYIVFDDHHFQADLQFEDAEPMFHRLLALCAKYGLEFGVKLTNTFPVTVAAGELPSEEMYMSGKSLYPLAIGLANRIEKAFDGKLRVSYSGGADFFNIDKIFACGIWPITLATTLLKPGGYDRLKPIAEKLVAMPYKSFDGVDLEALDKLAAETLQDPHHVKPIKPLPSRKVSQTVPLIDCSIATCQETCPIHQDIPTYVHLVGKGDLNKALEVICEKNPLPFITGTICSHTCQSTCTRNYYEETVQIRATKLEAAEGGQAALLDKLAPEAARSENVAIIGGGAAGMSAAFFLARAGAKATIFEKRDALGGIVRHVIPEFRISNEAILNDVKFLEKLGVDIRLNTAVQSVKELLEQGFTHVIIATGAWVPGSLKIDGCNVINVLDFMETLKRSPEQVKLGQNVIVIGGGNTAMDAARAAKRAPGVENVRLVYRRTKRYMPADAEELDLALEDGVEFCELLAPQQYEDGTLICEVMELGAPDASGRRRPVSTGKITSVPADSIIAAVGEKRDTAFLINCGIELNDRGQAKTDANLQAIDRVYLAGDVYRGPSTVVECIADATKAAMAILNSQVIETPFALDSESLKNKRAKLAHSHTDIADAARCLGCSAICQNCVDVCPNRANIAIVVPGMVQEQVLHLDMLCNECGNCTIFCPYSSSPYRDKFTVFATDAEFYDSTNEGFFVIDPSAYEVKVRLDGKESLIRLEDDSTVPDALKNTMKSMIDRYAYRL